jgi:mono/diheme cytochrome c family protein
MLPAEVQLILAVFLTLGIVLIVAWVGINESGRMQAFSRSYEARSVENGAVIFDSACSGCHGARGEGIEGVAPALNTPAMFNGERLAETGWTGSLEDFVSLTVAAGRPASTSYAQPMPTWGQEFGGPLRPDEVDDVVNFVLNWEESALAGEAPAVAQVPAEEEEVPAEGFIGTDMESGLPDGDPARGEALFVEQGCMGCHSLDGSTLVGPSMQGVGERASARVEGYSAEEYLRESILLPCEVLVDGFGCVMPPGFGQRLTPQDLADLIAYMLTE